MATAINSLAQDISLAEDGSIVEITLTNNGAEAIASPGFFVTAVYVDGTTQYVRSQAVASLAAAASTVLRLSIDGVATYDQANLHVGIGFVHTTT
ncbi:MAG: hypothetical protein E6X17_15625 [Sporomusaceae bacterium]|nr:hypothetical protein [Sporomusaceae bacterium]